ncbi:MAG: hypothetical protein AB6733_00280 [Clostridiaceae bacterium]
MKKYLIIITIAITTIIFAGCGGPSNLTKEDKALLSKSSITLTGNSNDWSSFFSLCNRKDLTDSDVQRITEYINSNISSQGDKNTFTYALEHRNDPEPEVTAEQKAANEEAAQAFVDKVNAYSTAETSIQTYIDATILKDSKVSQYSQKITVKADSVNREFTITIDVYRPYLSTLTVGDITKIRNDLVDSVQEYSKDFNAINITFVNGSNDLAQYVFTPTNGWDQEVKPWK